MTTDELDREIGRAFRERKDLLQKIECLKRRLKSTGEALVTLADNVLHAEAEETVREATDPRADFEELHKCQARLADLNKILR